MMNSLSPERGQPAARATPLHTVLRVVRCFNAAAFAALAVYYCAAYVAHTAPSQELALLPLPAASSGQ